jgi:CheY-like chemotaxis protein
MRGGRSARVPYTRISACPTDVTRGYFYAVVAALAFPAKRSPMAAHDLPTKVLVVDDHHDGAEALGTFLQLLGCEVRLVHSGEEALAVAPGYEPALVILDIEMPGISGLETARLMRSQPWARRSIFASHSASASPAIADLSREAGCHHHVPKPAVGDAFQKILAIVRAQEDAPD